MTNYFDEAIHNATSKKEAWALVRIFQNNLRLGIGYRKIEDALREIRKDLNNAGIDVRIYHFTSIESECN